jgi:hypothetical protein
VARGLAGVVGLAVLAVAAISIVVVRDGDDRSYGTSEVLDALSAQGLDVSEVTPGRATLFGRAFLRPGDGSFTVLVLPSDREARNSFRQYEGDTDPDTFELREGNVIIIADFSNSDTPLPLDTRRRIRRAMTALAAQ